jgi:hypothetical protein
MDANIADELLAFILGLFSGMIIQIARFRFSNIRDNWKDLKPCMEEIYCVVGDLRYESQHALDAQNKDTDSFMSTMTKIQQNLSTYREWYPRIESHGYLAKLNSIDEELGAALTGLSHFSFHSENDVKYVEQRLHRFCEIMSTSNKRLELFMKARIPHYMIFGKRKLMDWRECRF